MRKSKAQAFFEGVWKSRLQEAPELATQQGIDGYNDRWADYSKKAFAARKATKEKFLKTVMNWKGSLTESERLSMAILAESLKSDIQIERFPTHLMPADQILGPQGIIADTMDFHPTQTPKDFADALKRLKKLKPLIEQVQSLMNEGVENSLTLPRHVIPLLVGQIEPLIQADPLKSALLLPFTKIPTHFSESQKSRWIKDAITIYDDSVKPSLNSWVRFIQEVYQPRCRSSVGYGALPNGKEWYQAAVQLHTTTNMSPEDIHNTGKREVAQLLARKQDVLKKVGFKGTLSEFDHYLRSDEKFRCKTKEEILTRYREIGKRADEQMPKFFKTLPRTPYGVLPVPTYREVGSPGAYYVDGSLSSGRAGIFYANTYSLSAQPTYGMETLLLHEAVPGHHHQIALAQEIENVPEFQKHIFFTAYIEGWALYAESLGFEMGFYADPYQEYGHLEAMMFRACRLVVDTGLHAFGWSREQAIKYMTDHLAMGSDEIATEVDRYIVWPGQALSYKLGFLKIRELRKTAEMSLKTRFRLREFHDAILLHGALPLTLLAKVTDQWVNKMKKSKN